MEISPIREIRAVGASSTPKVDSEIQPPFALDPAARMDDAYSENDQAPELGQEEEDSETIGEPDERNDQPDTLLDRSDSETTINFFA
jgi:hypothetical protein